MDDEIDDATGIAILAAQVQDLDDLEDHHQTQDALTDEHLALRLYRQELQRYATTLRDHRIGILFGESPHTNHHLPELPLGGSPIFPTSTTLPRFLAETPSETDRHPTFQSDSNSPAGCTVQDLATGPDGTNEESNSSPGREDKILSVNNKNPSSNLPAHLFGVPQGSKRRRPKHSEDDHAENPSKARKVALPDSEQQESESESGVQIACIVCQDQFSRQQLSHLPCGHEYCHGCLMELFNSAMRDESLFPPRCCKQLIPPTMVQQHLPDGFPEAFRQRQLEMDTPNRTYCSNKPCSIFIRPSNMDGDKATCPECDTRTCTICKGGAHEGDCPQDSAVVALMAAAAREGFKQCPSCRVMVELTFGCNHMTCRCRAQFCYECGVSWKNCSCALFDDDRLLARAEQIVDRDGPRARGEARDAEVREVARAVEANHACTHPSTLQVRQGNLRCEACREVQDIYVNECPTCRLRECNWCKDERVTGIRRPRWQRRYGQSDGESDGDSYSDSYSDCESDEDSYSDSESDGDVDSDGESDGDSYSDDEST